MAATRRALGLVLALALAPALALGAPICAYEGPYGSACLAKDALTVGVGPASGIGASAAIEDREDGDANATAMRAHVDVVGATNASASVLQRHAFDEASGNETLLTEAVLDARASSRIAPQGARAGVTEESITHEGERECVHDEAYVALTGFLETPRLSFPLGCPAVPVLTDLLP